MRIARPSLAVLPSTLVGVVDVRIQLGSNEETRPGPPFG